ncbi:AmmeMemoRadiSam system protein B [Candidatus Uhrbacteria bacterium]|nr:AmmeMemoRadiSam system protein B [Candidatus Uhrbacteria bacterium]
MNRFFSAGFLASLVIPLANPFLFSDRAALIRQITEMPPRYANKEIEPGMLVGGVAPHHAPLTFSLIASFYAQLREARSDDPTFVIVGPDHYNKARQPIIISDRPFLTPYGALGIDSALVRKLLAKRLVAIDNEPFGKEHAIHSQTAFIKRFFPRSKIVAVLYRANASASQAQKVGAFIAREKGKGVFLIASIDFSHYYPVEKARKLDEQSAQALASVDIDEISRIDADSPSAIVTLLSYVASFSGTAFINTRIYNTADFSSNTKNTTGYITGFFTTPLTD